MPQNFFRLFRRIVRLRAPFVATLTFAIACGSPDSLDPNSSILPDETAVAPENTVTSEDELAPVAQPQLASASFAGGIPIGMNAQPVSAFGSRFNGAKIVVGPAGVINELSAIRSRGGKVIVSLSGSSRYFTDSKGHFDLNKWKDRVGRFKSKNFDPYIKDGTLMGHWLVDEPNDRNNWNGQQISPNTLEEMARYSKSLWPNLPTVVRTEPGYLNHNHRYLDAAWAQYLYRRGNVSDYIRRQVKDAQDRGVGLVVGLNVLKGGNPNGTRMTAKEVEQWGSALLSSSYPCAFFNYQHNSDYLSSSDVRSAMDKLRRTAENRGSKSCRG